MLSTALLQVIRGRTLRAYRQGDWRTVPILEGGEPLVEVPPECASPYYAREMHLTNDQRLFLRKGVLARFISARTILQDQGYDLIVYDGWRSIELQESLFWFYMREFTATRFNLQDQFRKLENLGAVRDHFLSLPSDLQTILREANRTYVSWPSKDPTRPSPHATGGSVDVWLYKGGEPANLGVPFDWMEEDAGAFYHLKWRRKRFAGNDRTICINRSRLLFAMIRAGFTCYGPEIWHFNHGNQMDALVYGGNAKYGYIEPAE